MISYIKGKLVEKNPAYVVLETAGGIAYFIHISLATFSKIRAKEGEELQLHTHYIVKEDAHTLYGFHDQKERELFRLLISVNGIGPNTARLILSSLNIHELAHAIATENVSTIQMIKGIGQKTAQRVIIDLKGKIEKTVASNVNAAKINSTCNNNRNEALSALISLGFVKNSAESTLDKIIQTEDVQLTVEELIKKALKIL